jgi:hypothetical protein
MCEQNQQIHKPDENIKPETNRVIEQKSHVIEQFKVRPVKESKDINKWPKPS